MASCSCDFVRVCVYICRLYVQMLSMQGRLEQAQKEYLSLKMEVEDETSSLKQQIHVMQKVMYGYHDNMYVHTVATIVDFF